MLRAWLMFLVISSLNLLLASPSVAESIAVEKVLTPLFVSVDRRPDKDLVYSKCVGVYLTKDKKTVIGGVAAKGDRVCPDASEIKVDYSEENGTETRITDGGDTQTKNFRADHNPNT